MHLYLASMLTGILSGLVVVAYRSAIGLAEHFKTCLSNAALASLPMLMAWIASVLLAGGVTSLLVRRSPLIKGSGIPQVKALLLRRITFNWKRELPAKFIGGTLALGAGLSLGREGPSIQLGALVGNALEELTRRHDYRRYLVTAGAAAGISAAFNAPLAGVLFCVEELHRSFSPLMLTSTMIASFAANAVMWLLFGTEPIFEINITQVIPLNYYFTVLLVTGVAAGIAGSLFNRGLLAMQKSYRQLVVSESVRLMIAFAVAALASMFIPDITGGGHHLVSASLLAGKTGMTLGLLFAGKLLFTLFCYASGAPGGIFLPMLAIGALLGGIINAVIVSFGSPFPYLSNLMLLGMTGFFVAVVRAPITGAVLITEMAGNFAHFPAFIFISIIASIVAGILKTKPIYDSLLAQIAPLACEDELQAVSLHIPWFEGAEYRKVSEIEPYLPANCVLTGVLREETHLFPDKDLELCAGDELLVETTLDRANKTKEHLLRLCRGKEHDL